MRVCVPVASAQVAPGATFSVSGAKRALTEPQADGHRLRHRAGVEDVDLGRAARGVLALRMVQRTRGFAAPGTRASPAEEPENPCTSVATMRPVLVETTVLTVATFWHLRRHVLDLHLTRLEDDPTVDWMDRSGGRHEGEDKVDHDGRRRRVQQGDVERVELAVEPPGKYHPPAVVLWHGASDQPDEPWTTWVVAHAATGKKMTVSDSHDPDDRAGMDGVDHGAGRHVHRRVHRGAGVADRGDGGRDRMRRRVGEDHEAR